MCVHVRVCVRVCMYAGVPVNVCLCTYSIGMWCVCISAVNDPTHEMF